MKKNIFTALIALILIICAIVPAMAEAVEATEISLDFAAAEASAAPVVEPTATPEPQPVEVPATVILAYKDGSINVRAESNTDSAVVTSLKHEDKITVILYGDVWSKILTKSGKEGYIKNVYIDDGNTLYAAGNEYFGTARKVTVAADTAMFAGASGETAQLSTLTAGAKLTALGVNGEYTLVATETGAQGYVMTVGLAE